MDSQANFPDVFPVQKYSGLYNQDHIDSVIDRILGNLRVQLKRKIHEKKGFSRALINIKATPTSITSHHVIESMEIGNETPQNKYYPCDNCKGEAVIYQFEKKKFKTCKVCNGRAYLEKFNEDRYYILMTPHFNKTGSHITPASQLESKDLLGEEQSIRSVYLVEPFGKNFCLYLQSLCNVLEYSVKVSFGVTNHTVTINNKTYDIPSNAPSKFKTDILYMIPGTRIEWNNTQINAVSTDGIKLDEMLKVISISFRCVNE